MTVVKIQLTYLTAFPILSSIKREFVTNKDLLDGPKKGGGMDKHYYAKDGLASIGKLMELKPNLAASFVTFDQQVFEEGALSTKTKELIAIGVAHVTRCPYCIEIHTGTMKLK
jgi:alkylhydroperoxidase/carboxymuconolactone decarboxylase family protein YurZ